MIRHIVFFKARSPETREEVFEGLRLLETNPHARFLEVGRNLHCDDWSEPVDFVVYGEFDDEEMLAAYKSHPIYAEATARVRPLRDLRLAADFVSRAGPQPSGPGKS
jgi:quinol monooxygenase YgiN